MHRASIFTSSRRCWPFFAFGRRIPRLIATARQPRYLILILGTRYHPSCTAGRLSNWAYHAAAFDSLARSPYPKSYIHRFPRLRQNRVLPVGCPARDRAVVSNSKTALRHKVLCRDRTSRNDAPDQDRPSAKSIIPSYATTGDPRLETEHVFGQGRAGLHPLPSGAGQSCARQLPGYGFSAQTIRSLKC